VEWAKLAQSRSVLPACFIFKIKQSEVFPTGKTFFQYIVRVFQEKPTETNVALCRNFLDPVSATNPVKS